MNPAAIDSIKGHCKSVNKNEILAIYSTDAAETAGTAAVPAAHTELTANYDVLYEQTLQLCENNEASPMNIDIEQSMVFAAGTAAVPGGANRIPCPCRKILQ